MLKPIEKDCLALVTRGDLEGDTVTVGDFVGQVGIFSPDDYWKVYSDKRRPPPGCVSVAREMCLLRLDGYDTTNDTEIEEIEQELIA